MKYLTRPCSLVCVPSADEMKLYRFVSLETHYPCCITFFKIMPCACDFAWTRGLPYSIPSCITHALVDGHVARLVTHLHCVLPLLCAFSRPTGSEEAWDDHEWDQHYQETSCTAAGWPDTPERQVNYSILYSVFAVVLMMIFLQLGHARACQVHVHHAKAWV